MRFDRIKTAGTAEGYLPFVGNLSAQQLLSSFADHGRFPHALLIEGPEGSGKKTLARLVAMAAVCTETTGEKPCGICPACRKAADSVHPDITELGGDGSAKSFHIEEIRTLRENAYVLPNESAYRVFILSNAQNMTEQAQNALLKILEEPPSHVLLILTCENRSQLLTTVQSRTVCLSLTGVSAADAAEAMKRLLPPPVPAEEELLRAATVFGGVIGQAIHGWQDGTFRHVTELAPAMVRAVAAPSEIDLLRLTGEMEKDKDAIFGILNSLELIFRDALVCKAGEPSRLSTAPEAAEELAARLTNRQLMALLREIEALRSARLHNMNLTLFSTLLCARLRTAAGH